jgi:hypothetical protein
MEFTRDDCKFTVPDHPTVRQQLRYFSAATGRDPAEKMQRFWDGAIQLIERWECVKLPDFKVDLDTLTDPLQTDIVIWVAFQVKLFMDRLDEVPKNS